MRYGRGWINPLAIASLAMAMSVPERRPRCEPELDEQSRADGTAVCKNCGRRLTLEDLGGGRPDGPYRAMPYCEGTR